MMNGSKPCGPLDAVRAPSPKRRPTRLRGFCAPSPQPSPAGEGETFSRALMIRPSSVVMCLRGEREGSGDCNRNISIFPHRANALRLPRERVELRTPRTALPPRADEPKRPTWSAPVLGRSGVVSGDGFRRVECDRACESCCARGRARSIRHLFLVRENEAHSNLGGWSFP